MKMSRLLAIPLALVSVALAAGCSHGPFSARADSQEQMQGLIYCSFDVSPDGKQIVFSGLGNGEKDLYLLDLSTNKVKQLTNTPDYENYPAFSPDGKSIAYQSAKDLASPRYLFLRSLDGKHVRQLTHNTNTSDSSPSFSRNGEQIVFCRSSKFYGDARGENTWDDQDVCVVNRNGSGLRALTHCHYKGMITPRFYPDGKTVLFDTVEFPGSNGFLPGNAQGSLAKVSTGGNGKVEQVMRLGTFDGCPYFFPDGRKVVFTVNSGGMVDLYLTSLSGDSPNPLISDRSNTGFTLPVVTSDGTKIYCTKAYGPELWEMNADGSGLHQIADSSLFSDPMHWNPGTK